MPADSLTWQHIRSRNSSGCMLRMRAVHWTLSWALENIRCASLANIEEDRKSLQAPWSLNPFSVNNNTKTHAMSQISRPQAQAQKMRKESPRNLHLPLPKLPISWALWLAISAHHPHLCWGFSIKKGKLRPLLGRLQDQFSMQPVTAKNASFCSTFKGDNAWLTKQPHFY